MEQLLGTHPDQQECIKQKINCLIQKLRKLIKETKKWKLDWKYEIVLAAFKVG